MAIAFAFVMKAVAVQAFFIPSESMVPTLKVHDRLLVDKVTYHFRDVHRGDIVVFSRPPGEENKDIKDLIKRVIALPGDTIEAHNGVVYLNGKILSEPYLPPSTYTDNLPKTVIPEGKIFVMGDNREWSEDSRVFGAIEEDSVVGRAVVRFWPVTGIGPV